MRLLRGGFRGRCGGRIPPTPPPPPPPSPFFLSNHLFFLQSLYFNIHTLKTLTYVYSNTIETCFIQNHLLFGRQLLYSSNVTSSVVRNLTVLSSTSDKINQISNHFLDRWRHGRVVNLRETQQTSKLDINSLKTNVNDNVLFFSEKVPRHFSTHSNASIT